MSKEIECIAGTDYDGDMKPAYLMGMLMPGGEFISGDVRLVIVDSYETSVPLVGKAPENLVFAEVSR